MIVKMTLQDFRQNVLASVPANLHSQAEEVFTSYGAGLSVPVATVVFSAAEKKCVPEMLAKLHKYFQDTVQHQHPDARAIYPSNKLFFGELHERLSTLEVA